MKKIILLVFAFAVTMTASAQITWNVKVGGGWAMCTSDIDSDMKGKFVGKIGVGIEKPLTHNFSLMPSLEVALKGTKCSYEPYEDAYYSIDENLSPLYIQIPVLGAYRFNLSDDWNLTFKAGPYFAYGISGKYENSYYNDDFDIFSDGDAKRFDAGVDVGVDFEYHRFVFGLEYERGFVSFAASDSDASIYNQAVYVTAGYKF